MKFLRKFLQRKNRTEPDALTLYMARFNKSTMADGKLASLVLQQYIARRNLGLNPLTGLAKESYSDQTDI